MENVYFIFENNNYDDYDSFNDDNNYDNDDDCLNDDDNCHDDAHLLWCDIYVILH